MIQVKSSQVKWAYCQIYIIISWTNTIWKIIHSSTNDNERCWIIAYWSLDSSIPIWKEAWWRLVDSIRVTRDNCMCVVCCKCKKKWPGVCILNPFDNKYVTGAYLWNGSQALWYQISITFVLLLREWNYRMWSEFNTCRKCCGVMIFTKLTPRLSIEMRANVIFKWNQLWNHKPFVKSDHCTNTNFVASHWVPLPI